MSLRIAVISTPIAPLDKSTGGGVGYRLRQLIKLTPQWGHALTVLAPRGSRGKQPRVTLVTVPGRLHVPAQYQRGQDLAVMPPRSVLVAMFDWVRKHQERFDVVLSFAYDWYAFAIAPSLRVPVVWYVSMCSMRDAFATLVAATARQYPQRVAFASGAQAATYGLAPEETTVLHGGLDLAQYQWRQTPQQVLGWAGRVSPEKGLETAFAVAQRTRLPLRVIGSIEDRAYWDRVRAQFPAVSCQHLGFLSTDALQLQLGSCLALVHLPTWQEAFGMVLLEALACGVPVVTWNQGGPTEIVRHGVSGYLVEPGNLALAAEAVANVRRIDRRTCRQTVVEKFNQEHYAQRLFAWLTNAANSSQK